MDPVSLLLDTPRSRTTTALRVLLSGDWSMLIEDGAPLTVCAVLRGECHLTRNDREHTLAAGQVLVLSGPEPYVMSDRPNLVPTISIGPGGECHGGDGRDLAAELSLGVRTWGNDIHGEVDLLIATYPSASEVGALLLESLPPEIIETTKIGDLRRLIAEQLTGTDPGQAAVVNRLLDVLLIATLRQWAGSAEAGPSWWAAHHDSIVADAIRRIDADDSGALTPDLLAHEAGLSRAAFNKRFREVVGIAPGEYSRRTRLAKAADMLSEPGMTLATMARRLGYSSPFSLSNAFKSQYGMSPKEYRAGRSSTSTSQAP